MSFQACFAGYIMVVSLVIHHYYRYTHRFFEAQSRLLFKFLSLASDLFLGRLGSTTIALVSRHQGWMPLQLLTTIPSTSSSLHTQWYSMFVLQMSPRDTPRIFPIICFGTHSTSIHLPLAVMPSKTRPILLRWVKNQKIIDFEDRTRRCWQKASFTSTFELDGWLRWVWEEHECGFF